MTNYFFQEGIPEGFNRDFDSGIFHDPRHLLLQAPAGWCSFTLLNENKTIGAEVHFHVEDGVAASPFRSPYGSFIFSENISSQELVEFIKQTEQALVRKGVHTIRVKNSPEVYSPEVTSLNQALIDLGYLIELEETSSAIPVTEKKFESILHRSELKKLRKCREAKLKVTLATLQELPEVYNFLNACRKEKDYSLSMSLQELQKVIRVFEYNFFLTKVEDDNQLVAANISIQVNKSVLYNFYHDHIRSYDAFSPVVLLNEGLYELCQQREISLLDLGTSNADGKLNESLLKFKTRLGGKPSRKLTFVKNIS